MPTQYKPETKKLIKRIQKYLHDRYLPNEIVTLTGKKRQWIYKLIKDNNLSRKVVEKK